MLTDDTIIKASPDQVSSKLDGERVILGLDNGTYFGLNQVGARIWDLLQQDTSVAALRGRLMEEYDVGKDRCQTDLLALLNELDKHGLIEVRK